MLPKTLLNYMESFEFEMQETLVEFKKNPQFRGFFLMHNLDFKLLPVHIIGKNPKRRAKPHFELMSFFNM